MIPHMTSGAACSRSAAQRRLKKKDIAVTTDGDKSPHPSIKALSPTETTGSSNLPRRLPVPVGGGGARQ